ncbi:peroxiredoxin-like family protein [Flavobacterium cerinum]|uniref:AhpC/TSA family protein n=1 Tax=Flavobacterium cerinum TaxID=2502784 RepID=A0ABY5IQ62_9FLAO|nr:peroxiredoxin-like family protein [Flavobacterium cerinum]UUC44347.1 AhpC/TSA family protein [Flavobacterium cerinum]
MNNLQKQIESLNEQLTSLLPREIQDAFQNTITELLSNHSKKNVIPLAATFPDFNLLTSSGETIHLSDIHTEEKLIIAFFRGSWCPYCNLELQALESVYTTIRSKKAVLIAVSPQLTPFNDQLTEQHQLSYPLLTDKNNALAQQLGITFELPDFVRPYYKQLGINLEDFNDDTRYILPIPAIFVIDQNNVICYSHIDPNYMNRVEMETLIAQL